MDKLIEEVTTYLSDKLSPKELDYVLWIIIKNTTDILSENKVAQNG